MICLIIKTSIYINEIYKNKSWKQNVRMRTDKILFSWILGALFIFLLIKIIRRRKLSFLLISVFHISHRYIWIYRNCRVLALFCPPLGTSRKRLSPIQVDGWMQLPRWHNATLSNPNTKSSRIECKQWRTSNFHNHNGFSFHSIIFILEAELFKFT